MEVQYATSTVLISRVDYTTRIPGSLKLLFNYTAKLSPTRWLTHVEQRMYVVCSNSSRVKIYNLNGRWTLVVSCLNIAKARSQSHDDVPTVSSLGVGQGFDLGPYVPIIIIAVTILLLYVGDKLTESMHVLQQDTS